MKRILCLLLWTLWGFQVASAQTIEPPYVILISLDGFRHDYVARFQPKNLTEFIKNGVSANGLIPSFPSKTFPNHYTIATGLKPEHHGLVDNNFYNPGKNQQYSISNRSIVEDGSWYGGTPIWVLAEQNGLKAASYFFVGSEAEIQGYRPSYYYNYDGSVSNLTRISKVFEWLQLPDDERPRLITLYFSDMDDAGHRYGPNNDFQLKKSLDRLDHQLGALFEGLASMSLPINVVIVSDHGMAEVPKENLISIDPLLEGVAARVVNSGALVHLHLEKPSKKRKIIKQIQESGKNIHVVDVDDREFYQDLSLHRDFMGDILIIPEIGYYLTDDRGLFRYQNRSAMQKTEVFGEHGYSPDYPEMHGIFYARGPLLKKGITIDSFENVHIYPLLCRLLGLPIPQEIDGDGSVLDPIVITPDQ